MVTGGAGGIGSEICRRFAEEGAKVAVFDINKEAADKVAAAIRSNSAGAGTFAVDLTSQDSVTEAVASTERELGPIDVLVNNDAGWDQAGNFLDTDPARLMVFKLIMAAAKTWHRLKGENQLPKVVAGVTVPQRRRGDRRAKKKRRLKRPVTQFPA